MPRESFPQIQVPEIYVNIPYPGNSPEIITDKSDNGRNILDTKIDKVCVFKVILACKSKSFK